MCDKLITLKKGLILYNGVYLSTDKCPTKYTYKIEDEYNNNYVLYTGNDIKIGIGYAGSCLSNDYGWIRAYKLKKDIKLANITENMEHYEVDEVKEEFCNKCNGYYLDWDINKGDSKEIVFCDPEKFLELIKVWKCKGKGTYEEVNCNIEQLGGKYKIDKRYGKYIHNNHTHKTKKSLNKCNKN